MNYTLNIKGRLFSLKEPVVMGILNCTPDSFFAGSRKQTEKEIADRANEIVAQGGKIIDVGAFSTRPGADEVSEEEEMRRSTMFRKAASRESWTSRSKSIMMWRRRRTTNSRIIPRSSA